MFARLLPIAVIAAGLSSGSAQAATFYSSYAGWNDDTTGTLVYEDFSDPVSSADVLAINSDLTSTAVGGVSSGYQRVNGGELQLSWGDGLFEGEPARFSSFTWDFAEAITGFHLTLGDFESGFTMSFDEGTGVEVFDLHSFTSGSGPFGFQFDQAISSITFSTTWNYDLSSMDDLYYKIASNTSVVPVPAALPLLLGGLGGLGFLGWRNKRITAS